MFPKKGGSKKFSFGFPSKKDDDSKRKQAEDLSLETNSKKQKITTTITDDADEFLASAGIGKSIVAVIE
jgi:hypothetical protein